MKNKKVFGFTLIELLIVVAIIAILAAIAIPNFLAAQVRAKVARTKGEMRSLATALEAYYVDNNAYVNAYRYDPWTGSVRFISQCSHRMELLTTPISYITSIPKPDPFGNSWSLPEEYDSYDYVDEATFIQLRGEALAKNQWGGSTWGRAWRLCGSGPKKQNTYADNVFGSVYAGGTYPGPGWPAYYDPSNGTVSNGDIIRFGPTGKLGYEDKIVGPIFDN